MSSGLNHKVDTPKDQSITDDSGYLSADPGGSTGDIKFVEYLNPLARDSLGTDYNLKSLPQSQQKVCHTNKQHKPVNMRELRFDSGVADLDQATSPLHRMPSPNTAFRPISTNKTYDYAEYGAHQYEELPHSRLQLQASGPQMSPCSTDSRSSDNQSSTGTTVTISDVPSDAGDTANIIRSQKDEEQRKRYNPLYDAMINTTPNIYNKVRVTRESMLQTQIRLLRMIVIILIFISCTSLSLSLYLIISNSSDSSVKNLKKEVSTLEEQFAGLQNRIKQVERLMAGNLSFDHLAQLGVKVLELESTVTSNFTTIDKKLEITNHKIDINKENILSVYQNYTANLSAMNNTVQYQLDTFRKMEGPQGLPGVGNLTACFLKEHRTTTDSTAADTKTDIVPTQSDAAYYQDYVIMSVYCSVKDGLYTRMEIQSGDNTNVKYKCICTGQLSAAAKYRECAIHLWLCPRESFGDKSLKDSR